MRYLDLMVAGLFLLMSVIQLNDPDPAYWVLVYGAVGILALGAFRGKHNQLWTGVAIGAVLAGMIIAVPGFFEYFRAGDPASLTGAMLPEKPWVEPAREFIGLLMALVALVWYYRRGRV